MPNGPGEPLYLEAREGLPPEPPPLRRRSMVRWYSPRLLLATGVQVLVSAALGNRIDYRLMEADGGDQPSFKYDRDRDGRWVDELWLDYLADTGDGWNSTYAVASLVGRHELEVDGRSLPRGQILILGGDEVYPYPSQRSYRERLVGPFRTALPRTEAPHPHLFAIPGNHDWYDNLVSFSRRFGQERWIGGWQTLQRRSYFALKLPHRWWLWAVDVQLESDID
ncbi:MAG: metallophosphoesterase, partial [Candidatus Rokubacteria bacterium]|nr:metallophosphoesterase [Candidatus Rokubacteria bacterium]